MTEVIQVIKRRNKKVSKKIALVAVMTLVLVFAAASWAFAAQNVQFNGSNNGFNDFAATPGTFTPDGNANYPNEIYLPNEKTPADYPIHSNYTSTTDACASCHTTHTAVGENLLQWGSVYDACMACHDGTVSTTYNVVDGKIGNTNALTSAGLFGHGTEASLSNHNVSGAMSVYAAPGGPGTAGLDLTAPWDAEFSCASCHTPHGMGGNARLLNPDVNGAATAAYTAGTTKGVDLKSIGSFQYVTDYDNNSINDTWLYSGHGYSDKVAIYDAAGTKLASGAYTISNATGYTVVTIPGATGPFKADFIAAVKVTMKVSDKLTANEKVQHETGLNGFCGACHVDYDTSKVDGPTGNLNGTYTEAYRHKVGFDRTKSLTTMNSMNMKLESPSGDPSVKPNNVTCETCHVAHGTDAAYWETTLKNANNGNLPAGMTTASLTELAGSSALKRLPNMGVCEACHAKGKASEGYTANNGGSATYTSNPSDNAEGGGYVGQSACASCHGDMSKHYNETWHPDISRPGLTEKVAAQAATQGSELDTIVPGFAAAVASTQPQINKVGYDDRGRLKLDPADWANKGVDPAKIQVWSTGTDTGQEIMVRGSALGEEYVADKWYIVAVLDGSGKIVSTGTEPEDYGCGTRGCHTTGYEAAKASNPSLTGASTDFTLWINAAAAGSKVPFELGVTCEACHGQGGNHAKAPSANNIVNPANFSTRIQTVGLQSGNGTFTTFDGKKAYFDYINGLGNAKACGQCHSSAHHQADFFTQTVNGTLVWPKVPGQNAHFLGTTTGVDSGTTVAGCTSCHSSHEESADPGQLIRPTVAETCQPCHPNDGMGTKQADGTIKGLTFEAGSTTRIVHTFPY